MGIKASDLADNAVVAIVVSKSGCIVLEYKGIAVDSEIERLGFGSIVRNTCIYQTLIESVIFVKFSYAV